MTLVLAAAIQDQVEKYGAYAGIASFFGLAALALLYFSQARELKRLRDWAGRAPERAAEMEARVVAQAEQRRVRATPVPRPATAAGAAAPATQAGQAAAVAGGPPVAATAAGQAATALADPPQPGTGAPAGDTAAAEGPGDGAQTGPAPASPGTPAPAGAPAAAASPGSPGPGAPAPAATPAPGGTPTPAPDAAGAAGGTAAPTPGAAAAPGAPAPAPESVDQETEESDALEPDTGESDLAGGNGAPSAPPVIPRATPAPRAAAALRSSSPAASPRRPAPPPRRPAPAPKARERSGRKAVLAILGVIAVVGIGGFAASRIFGGDETPQVREPNTTANQPAETPESDGASTESGSATLARGETQVSVFNGTTIGGLAATTADKLRAAGFPAPLTGNNPDQQRAATLVLYASRPARRSALEVARLLKVSDPQPMDERTRAQAGPEADVVVIVGSDQTQ